MIESRALSIAYEDKLVVDDFSFSVREGEILSIIGPNGSGKSTVLKAVSRFIKSRSGCIYLEEDDMKDMNIKCISKKMATLSQCNKSPEDITVKELVYYGRMPHKRWHERRNARDYEVVNWALKETSLLKYRDKKVSDLSGGERQRVWIAMALAQEPRVLLLDEPTTYLDICHQLEVMELVKKLNKNLNLTVVMVLHDLGQAANYSDRVLVIKDGSIVTEGRPADVLTRELIKKVYSVDVCIRIDEEGHGMMIYPLRVCREEEEQGE